METESDAKDKSEAKVKDAPKAGAHKKCKLIIGLLALLFVGSSAFAAYNYKDNQDQKNDMRDQASSAQSKYDALKTKYDKATKSKTQSSKNKTEQQPDETADWKVYTNAKYGYAFKYPADWKLGDCSTKPNCKYLHESEGGDNVNGGSVTENTDWPVIDVIHYNTQFYNPPAGTNLVEWISTQLPETKGYISGNKILYFTYGEGHLLGAYDFTLPASPQTYSHRFIYIPWQNKLFKIMLTAPDKPGASDFYNTWLSTFSIDGQI